MKHFYHNKRLAKRLAGGLQPTVKKLGEICGKKISTQDVYAATLGFENWDGFVESPTPDIKSCPHSTLHWENNFSLHLLRKWDEECEASYSQAIHQLVADLQKSNPLRGGDDFEGIAYEENDPLFSSQAFSAKLQECLETKTPPAIKAQDHSLRFDTRTHDSAGRAINPQAYVLAVGPNPQARAYQQQVIYFARECFRHIGRKQARASKQWSLEFAYDIYAEALRREFFFWNKGWSHPLLFSEFYAKELGYIDFDNYQKEQKTSATCNYDSRADTELRPEARELRQKLREGYLFRYLSTLDLQPEHQFMAFQELCSVLKTNHSLYNLTIAQQSESLHWAHISALPASGSIIRLMDRIEAAKKGADILSDDEYADLIDVCTDPSNGYQGTVLPALRPLCHRWVNRP